MIQHLLVSAIYWLALLAAGYAAVSLLRVGRSRLDAFGLAACIGPGVFGAVLIAVSMLGFAPTGVEVAVIAVVFAAIAGGLWRRLKRQFEPIHRIPLGKGWRILAAIVLCYGIGVVAADALFLPVIDWDATAIWQFKSKILLDSPLVPRPAYFNNASFSYSHLRYPILAPMISAGARAIADPTDDAIGKSPFLLMYLGLGAVVYAEIRRWRGSNVAVVPTLLLMTLPVLLIFAGSGAAEMPLLAFFAASLVGLLRWQEDRRWGDLILAALASAFMMWTKNEGIAMGVFNGLAIALLTPAPLSRRSVKGTILFVAIVSMLFAPWLIYTHGLPRTDENYAGRLASGEFVRHLSDMANAGGHLLYELVRVQDWSCFWFVLAAAMLIQRKIRRPVLTLYLLMALQFLAYSAALAVSNWDPTQLLPVVQHRLMLHITPAAALALGILWPTRKEEMGKRATPDPI